MTALFATLALFMQAPAAQPTAVIGQPALAFSVPAADCATTARSTTVQNATRLGPRTT